MSRTSATTSSIRSLTAAERVRAEVQAVEHPHPIAAVEQSRYEHGADVSGAAGDQDPLARARRLRRQAV